MPVSRAYLDGVGRSGGHAVNVEHDDGAEPAHRLDERLFVGAFLEGVPVGVAIVITGRDERAAADELRYGEREGSREIVGGLHPPLAPL